VRCRVSAQRVTRQEPVDIPVCDFAEITYGCIVTSIDLILEADAN
jgi:hypothetical protein